jgi:hypothetical protein
MCPRNSIRVQSENIIIDVYTPDTTFRAYTNISNTITRNLVPVRATVYINNSFHYNWYMCVCILIFARRGPLIDILTRVCSPNIIVVTYSYTR